MKAYCLTEFINYTIKNIHFQHQIIHFDNRNYFLKNLKAQKSQNKMNL